MEHKNTWETYQAKQLKEVDEFAQEYMAFLDNGKTERECIDQIVNMIEHAETIDMKPVFETIKTQKAKIYGISDKYEKYLDRKLFGSDTKRVVRGVMLFDMYILMLSEVYRMKYIR